MAVTFESVLVFGVEEADVLVGSEFYLQPRESLLELSVQLFGDQLIQNFLEGLHVTRLYAIYDLEIWGKRLLKV